MNKIEKKRVEKKEYSKPNVKTIQASIERMAIWGKH